MAITSKSSSSSYRLIPSGVDLPLLFTVAALSVLGLIMVYSASYIYSIERTGDGWVFVRKQAFVFTLGWLALLGVARFRPNLWQHWSLFLLALSAVLLLMVWMPGVGMRVGGAQRWIRLGGFAFQPAEFAKFSILIFAARHLSQNHERLKDFKVGVLHLWGALLPLLVLLMAQPDFGNSVVMTVSIFLMMFLAGVPLRFLGGMVGLAGAAGVGLVLAAPYRMARMATFMDPWKDAQGSGFQVIQSLLSFYEGKAWGVGLGHGREKLFYLPEAHNDFLFSVLGEELGFIGVVGVVSLFVFLLFRGLKISWLSYSSKRNGSDLFGFLLASGITMTLAFQGFVNMSVVMGLMPTKGLPLPLLSYGGTSLFMNFLAIGVLVSVGRTTRT